MQAAMTSAKMVLLRIFLRRICSTSELMPAKELESVPTLPREAVKRDRWFSRALFVAKAWLQTNCLSAN